VRAITPSNAGRFRICRRFFVLIYATAAAYFLYAPWNYLFLGVLLLRRHAAEDLRGKS
jgi:hypothetical protein